MKFSQEEAKEKHYGLWCWTLVSSTNKTDLHDITDRLFNVALYTISQTKPNLITPGIITLFIYLYTIPRAGELTTDRVCKLFFSRVLPIE